MILLDLDIHVNMALITAAKMLWLAYNCACIANVNMTSKKLLFRTIVTLLYSHYSDVQLVLPWSHVRGVFSFLIQFVPFISKWRFH